MTNIKRQSGVGLVEIMISLVIALFLLFGLGTIFITTKYTYGAQQNLSNLQDNERLAMLMLTNVIQTGGYFPNPDTSTAAASLPAAAPYVVGGQAVSGTDGATVTVPDTVRARYVTVAGDTIEDCNGGNATGTKDNVFSINPPNPPPPPNPPNLLNPPTLQCAVNGANPQPLVSGVQNMKVLYGVDPTNSPSISAITAYVQAGAVANWNTVKSVRITLTFLNPLFGQPGQPATFSFTTIVPVMNKI